LLIGCWRPSLCAEEENDTLYSYTQISKDKFGDLVLDGRSRSLALITTPIPTARAPPDRS
jgi:hypothetical protein